MKKAKITLTPAQVDYLAKYLAATNLATPLGAGPGEGSLPRYIDDLWANCRSTHAFEDIDVTPEYKSFVRDLKKDPTYWVQQFEQDFGAGALGKLG